MTSSEKSINEESRSSLVLNLGVGYEAVAVCTFEGVVVAVILTDVLTSEVDWSKVGCFSFRSSKTESSGSEESKSESFEVFHD